MKVIAKSGIFTKNVDHSTAVDAPNCFYTSFVSGQKANGDRLLEIEGGEFWNIAGGCDENDASGTNYVNLKIRLKGGIIHGCVFGGAALRPSHGSKQMIFTGGAIEGWIAGGSNGIGSNSEGYGITKGYSYIYVGGNTRVDSHGSNTKLDNSVGGYVFGAGCGNPDISSAGRMESGSNVVIADNAYIERGVYGGGAYGDSPATANVYITGGHIGAVYDDAFRVNGGVFGGARQKLGGNTNIYMDGGLVEGGLYGGSNKIGTLSGSVTMQINGGQVGTEDISANIHGGGYGKDTGVTGNIDITLGKVTEDDTETGAVIYGNVYGGSALGKVNGSGDGSTIDSSKHTYVTMNLGSINGNIFGGGMGELNGTGRNATPVTGEGVVNGQIKVTINGTDATKVTGTTKDYAVDGVFGGCDMVGYAGTPVVIINNCKSSIGYVYGGGNASSVTGTNVTINGGDIDYTFGGGNGADTTKPGADVNGDAVINIYGGTINNIFGGSNTLGDVTGKATVTLEDKNTTCPITAEEVYGGANEAPMTGAPELNIVCLKKKLDKVYGGARAVDVNSDVTLTITGGQYGQVFAGNNVKGAIKGSMTVNIEETGCSPVIIDELYGGGNMAAYSVYGYNDDGTSKTSGTKVYEDPEVNVISCTRIGKVFGGGYGKSAVVTGNPIVNINMIKGAFSEDVTNIWKNKLGTIGEVYGGGNAANVNGDTYVNIGTLEKVTSVSGSTEGDEIVTEGANISGNVYGGGNAADVTGKTNVTVGRQK